MANDRITHIDEIERAAIRHLTEDGGLRVDAVLPAGSHRRRVQAHGASALIVGPAAVPTAADVDQAADSRGDGTRCIVYAAAFPVAAKTRADAIGVQLFSLASPTSLPWPESQAAWAAVDSDDESFEDDEADYLDDVDFQEYEESEAEAQRHWQRLGAWVCPDAFVFSHLVGASVFVWQPPFSSETHRVFDPSTSAVRDGTGHPIGFHRAALICGGGSTDEHTGWIGAFDAQGIELWRQVTSPYTNLQFTMAGKVHDGTAVATFGIAPDRFALGGFDAESGARRWWIETLQIAAVIVERDRVVVGELDGGDVWFRVLKLETGEQVARWRCPFLPSSGSLDPTANLMWNMAAAANADGTHDISAFDISTGAVLGSVCIQPGEFSAHGGRLISTDDNGFVAQSPSGERRQFGRGFRVISIKDARVVGVSDHGLAWWDLDSYEKRWEVPLEPLSDGEGSAYIPDDGSAWDGGDLLAIIGSTLAVINEDTGGVRQQSALHGFVWEIVGVMSGPTYRSAVLKGLGRLILVPVVEPSRGPVAAALDLLDDVTDALTAGDSPLALPSPESGS